MIRELFQFIDRHRTAACLAVVVVLLECAGALYLYSIIFPGAAPPAVTPTAQMTITPLPTAAPTPSPTAEPSPEATTAPASPTVTPDKAIERSLTPLSQYAPKYMVHVERSMDMGLLSIDLTKSDTGGQYAYRNDTYTVRLALVDTSSVPVDRIRIRTTCINGTGSGYSLYGDERVDHVLLDHGDVINRTVGFKVAADAPAGIYKLRIEVSADLAGNDTWLDLGCDYESGLNILTAEQ